MRIGSAIAIYFLFWFMSLFLVLPFGVKNAREAGDDLVAGQEHGAPHHFDVWRAVRRTTLVSAILFGAYYANYMYGWVTPESFGL